MFTDDEWQGLCRAMGHPPWAVAGRFASAPGRWQNQDELDASISEWTREREDCDVMHLLQAEGVAAGPVMDERDCYADPHLRERGFFEPVYGPLALARRIIWPGARVSGGRPRGASPGFPSDRCTACR